MEVQIKNIEKNNRIRFVKCFHEDESLIESDSEDEDEGEETPTTKKAREVYIYFY